MQSYPVNERCYQEVFENNPEAAFVVACLPGGKFRFDSLNPAAMRLLDPLGRGLAGVGLGELAAYVPDSWIDAATMIRHLHQCRETRRPVDYEDAIGRMPDGAPRFCAIRLAPVTGAGGIERIIGYVRDVAGCGQRCRQLRDVEHELGLFRRAINHSAEAFFLIDERLRFIEVNGAACRSLGYVREELLGMTPMDIDPDMTREICQELMDRGMGNASVFEARHRARDGRTFPVEVSGVTFVHGGRKFSMTMARDIDERKRIEEALEFIAQGAWLVEGDDFLPALARYLGRTLGVDYVVIDKLASDRRHAETVALYARGELVPNMRYALQHTPCENVMTGGVCCYASGVQRQFPLDTLLVDMQVDSYAGIPLRNAKGEVLGLIAVLDGKPMADMDAVSSLLQLVAPSATAELKRSEAENELRASRAALAEAQRIAQVGSWELDIPSGRLSWSDEVFRIFEIDRQKFGASYEAFLNIIHPEDRDAVNEAYTSSLENRTPYCIDHRLLFADGRIKHVRECCETHYGEVGQPLRSIGTVQDISERKQMETELRRQADFQQSLLNAMNEVGLQLMVLDEGQITYVSNRKLAREFGYTDEELDESPPLLDIIHPDDRARVMDYYVRRMEGDASVPNSYELGLVTRSGERREYETSVVPVPGSSPSRLISVGKDITARKHDQRRLELLERAVSQSSEAYFLIDQDLRFVDVNEAACRSLGYSRDELLGLTPPDIDPDVSRETVEKLTQGNRGMPSVFESRHRTKDGRIFPVEISGTTFMQDGALYSMTLVRDISERKRMEATLMKSYDALEEAQRIGNIGSWDVDMVNDRLTWSDETFRIWEIDKQKFEATFSAFVETVHPEDRGRVVRIYNESISNRTLYEVEHRLLFPDGRIKHILERGQPYFDADGKPVRFVGTSLEITERKLAEAALQASERLARSRGELLSSVIESSPEIIVFALDVNYCYLSYNRRHKETMRAIWGKDIEPGMNVLDVIGCHADREAAQRGFDRALSGESFVEERAYGDEALMREYWQNFYSPIRSESGEVTGMTCFVLNISARRHMEAALAEREREFRSLAENIPDNVVRWDVEGRYLYVNPVHERTLEKRLDEVVGQFIPDSHDAVKAAIARVAATGEAIHVLRQKVVVGGVDQLHDVSMVPEFDTHGKLVSVLGLGRDMTDIYRMQEAITQREQEFRSLAESSPDNIIRYDMEGRIRYLNANLIHFLGLDSAEEVLGKRPSEAWPDGRFAAIEVASARVCASGEPERIELTVQTGGGVEYHQARIVAERDAAGTIVGALLFGRDVTAFRETTLRLSHFINSIPGLAYTFRLAHDGHASFPYVSSAIEDIYGVRPEEVMKDFTLIHNLAHPDDRPRIEAAITESARELTPFRVESRVCRQGHPERWLDVRSVPEPQPDGSILWHGIMLDITERKQAEVLLEQRERESRRQARFQQSLLSGLRDAGIMLVVVENGCFVYTNDHYVGCQLGYAEGELHEKVNFIELIHPDDRPRIAEMHRDRMAGKPVPDSYEIGALGGDGSRREYEFHVTMVPDTDPQQTLLLTLRIDERKRQEDELRRREQEFRVLVESSPDPIVRYDRELRRIYINPAWEAVNGISVAAALGQRPSELSGVVSATVLEYEARLRRVLDCGVPEEIEIGGSDGAGNLRHFAMRVVPEFGEDGKVASLLTVARDITERRKAAERLEQAQKIARLGSWDWDVVADRVAWSDMAYEIYTPDKWPAAPGFEEFRQSVHPDDREMVAAAVNAAFEHDAPFDLDHRVVSVSKGVRVVHAQGKVYRGANGKPVRMVGTVQDITEYKRLEAGLRESRNFLRMIMNGISDPIFVKDRQHRWIEFNESFRVMVGQPREAMLGKSDYDFLPKEQADVFWAKDEEVFGFGGVNVNEEAITGKDGIARYIQTKKTPIFPEGGEPLLVGVIRDITERRELELAREAALSEAVRLGQLRSAFLAQMSHELRTPLNGILGYTQNLLLDGSLSEKQRSSLNIIQHSGDHLLGLLNDVLDHARMEADKLELNIRDIRLDVLLRTVTELVQVKAEQKRLEFVCQVEPGLPAVIRGDSQRLRQVLLNLLSNAVKFTEHGQVSLRVTPPRAGLVRFEVRDTGIGIAADKQESIFRPFERAGEGSQHSAGTGLGLAISRKLVQLMGGDIAVESEAGKGSVFSFELELEAVQDEALDTAIGQAAAKPEVRDAVPLLAPPAQELESLYELAKRGNMSGIRRRLAELAAGDARYAPFCEKLGLLAQGYQSRAILQFIERHLAGREPEA